MQNTKIDRVWTYGLEEKREKNVTKEEGDGDGEEEKSTAAIIESTVTVPKAAAATIHQHKKTRQKCRNSRTYFS